MLKCSRWHADGFLGKHLKLVKSAANWKQFRCQLRLKIDVPFLARNEWKLIERQKGDKHNRVCRARSRILRMLHNRNNLAFLVKFIAEVCVIHDVLKPISRARFL